MRPILVLLVMALAGTAHAQTTGLLRRTPGTGLDQPGTSIALEDGPAASVINPAGLAMQRGPALRYLHQEGEGRTGIDGDGLYFGLPLFDLLGFGLAFEWLEPEPVGLRSHRRTTWSLAVGDRRLALGASAHLFSGGPLDDSTTWDVGLLSRPSRALSLAFTLRDADATRFNGRRLARAYVLGLGLRPLGDWLTIAAEAEVLGGEDDFLPHGFDSTALGATVVAELLPGLRLFGGYTHRIDTGPEAVQFGLRLGAGALSVEGAPLLRTEGDDAWGWVAAATLGPPAHRDVRRRPGSRFAVVRLDEVFAARPSLLSFSRAPRDPMIDAVEGLAALGRDSSVEGVILDLREPLPLGLGNAWELHQAVLELRARGKKVLAYLEGGDDATYLVAAAAERVVASPPAAFTINGFASRADFFASTLDAIGVHVEVVRIGAYKTAPDALTRSSIDEAQREVMVSLLDDLFDRYVAALSRARGMPEDVVRQRLEVGLRSARSAREAGWVDEIAYRDELPRVLSAWIGREVRTFDRSLRPAAWTHWSEPPEIAVIPITGTIVAGSSDPFGFVPTTGDRSVVSALRRAVADTSVRAIVLRIDSGGGDAGASQRIWRAVREAAQRKPVVAAMGDVAASGGYFAAIGAERVFATPMTYTGSIGVFWLKPNVEGLMERIEVGSHVEKRGAQADILSWRTGWTEGMRKSIQETVDSLYLDFLDATAQGTGLSIEEVDAVARGRVWTGAQANERRLVHDLGGLAAAVRTARIEAGLDEDATVRYRVYAPTPSLLTAAMTSRATLDGPLGDLLRAAVPVPILLWNGSGLWALSPVAWWADRPDRL